MVVIEVAPNPNCEPVELRIFHDVEPPRRVQRLLVARPGGGPASWHDVTGWTAEGVPCPAMSQRVDDSGEGSALLVFGGTGGLRFRPAGSTRPWELADAEQWGAPFLLTAEDAVHG
jgi:hypothetical protein